MYVASQLSFFEEKVSKMLLASLRSYTEHNLKTNSFESFVIAFKDSPDYKTKNFSGLSPNSHPLGY